MYSAKTFTIGSLLMVLSVSAFAQTEETAAKTTDASQKLTMGYHLSDVQKSFGIGLNVTSPYFLKKSVAVRLRGNLQFLQHIPATAPVAEVWSPYGMWQLGLVGGNGIVKKNMRFYGEGGVVFIMPNNDFSSNTTVGGYGLFGFEFFLAKRCAFHIEMGGMGTGAVAEKSVGKPIYANGFITNVGVRLLM